MNDDGIMAIILGIVWTLMGIWMLFDSMYLLATMFLVFGICGLISGGITRGAYLQYWKR